MRWIDEDELYELPVQLEEEDDESAAYFDVPVQYRPIQKLTRGKRYESIRTN